MTRSSGSPLPPSGTGQPVRGDVLAGDRPWLPYPCGWFCVGFSRELPAGRVITRRLAGEDVVLYRTRAGAVHAVRPYCPHLGAHLGVGGTVDGELLVCPFHRFAFAPDGTCAKAPGGKPPRARVDQHPVRERNGIIYLWHGAGEPEWELPEVDDTGFGPTVSWRTDLATHPQEVLENTVDYVHLKELHGMDVHETFPLEMEGPYLRLRMKVRAATVPVLGDIIVDQPLQLAGLGWALTEVVLPNNAPAVRVWVLPTPIDPWRTRHHFAVAGASVLPAGLNRRLLKPLANVVSQAAAMMFLRVTVKLFGDDEPIWNHKKHYHHPRFAPEEKAIGPYRHWARQFYRDSQPQYPDTTTPL